jgi:hypothetical protein
MVLHKVEPRRLPENTYKVSAKVYTQIKAKGRDGIPVYDLGSLYVSRIAKGVFDAVVTTQQLCCHVFTKYELKTAKQSFHILRRFTHHRWKIFESSKFVRQSLRVISITLRIAERRLRQRTARMSGLTAELKGFAALKLNSCNPSGL